MIAFLNNFLMNLSNFLKNSTHCLFIFMHGQRVRYLTKRVHPLAIQVLLFMHLNIVIFLIKNGAAHLLHPQRSSADHRII